MKLRNLVASAFMFAALSTGFVASQATAQTLRAPVASEDPMNPAPVPPPPGPNF